MQMSSKPMKRILQCCCQNSWVCRLTGSWQTDQNHNKGCRTKENNEGNEKKDQRNLCQTHDFLGIHWNMWYHALPIVPLWLMNHHQPINKIANEERQEQEDLWWTNPQVDCMIQSSTGKLAWVHMSTEPMVLDWIVLEMRSNVLGIHPSKSECTRVILMNCNMHGRNCGNV